MNVAIAQSGGPTCAINASLLGAFREAFKTPDIDAIFGSINGIEGIIKDELIDLKRVIQTNKDCELLRQTPSTILGSCRYKLPDFKDNPQVYETITHCLKKHQIGIFLYIGGNDSMDTVEKLSAYLRSISCDIKVIGIPKTIDNDLPVTDHTPGFGSAAKYVATTVQEIIRDSSVYSIESVTIVEIMGRNAGWLTASTCVLRANGEIAPHLIYLPEGHFSIPDFLEDLRREQAKHKAVIVAVSEGIDVSSISSDEEDVKEGVDAFGHRFLNGIGKYLEQIVAKELGCKVRSIELNVMQRCSSHLCSKTDIEEAEQIGAAGFRAALNGSTGKMMYFKRVSDMPYEIVIDMVDVSETANKEKLFPSRFINERQNNVTDEAVRYFLPLIQGEVILQMSNGIPMHFKLR